MDIVQIKEKYWAQSYKAVCYRIEVQKLYEVIATLNSYDVQYKRFIKSIKNDKIKFMLMDDVNFIIYIVMEDFKVSRFKLGDTYDMVYSAVIDNYSGDTVLTKDGWEDYISETMWLDFETEKDEIALIPGVKKFKPRALWKKSNIVKISKDVLKEKISISNTFLSNMILVLLPELKGIAYWDEEKVIALYFNTDALLPLNLNDKAYEVMAEYINQLGGKK